MRLVGYVRVSTDAQVDGFGLEVQREQLAETAMTHGHHLVAVLADEGVSGTEDVDCREGLARALAMLQAGDADVLLVPRLDRLARSLVLQEQLLAEVRRVGGRAMSCASGEQAFLDDDPSDPSRRLIRQILGSVAEYERAMIRLRLRAGQRAKAARGGYAGGRPPFGWRAHGAELVEDQAEQDTVALMIERRRAGDSYRTIARVLDDRLVQGRGGGAWRPETVRSVLKRAGLAAETAHEAARRARRVAAQIPADGLPRP